MKKTIHVLHAGTGGQIVSGLNQLFKDSGNVQVIETKCIDGSELPITSEWFGDNMRRSQKADLTVVVYDSESAEMAMKILKLCENGRPLLFFYPKGQKVNEYIARCIGYHRMKAMFGDVRNAPNPIELENVDQVAKLVMDWHDRNIKNVLAHLN